MKKRYTKKQIQEAIAYWERRLEAMNESAGDPCGIKSMSWEEWKDWARKFSAKATGEKWDVFHIGEFGSSLDLNRAKVDRAYAEEHIAKAEKLADALKRIGYDADAYVEADVGGAFSKEISTRDFDFERHGGAKYWYWGQPNVKIKGVYKEPARQTPSWKDATRGLVDRDMLEEDGPGDERIKDQVDRVMEKASDEFGSGDRYEFDRWQEEAAAEVESRIMDGGYSFDELVDVAVNAIHDLQQDYEDREADYAKGPDEPWDYEG